MGQIYVANKNLGEENIRKQYPTAFILDVTSSSPNAPEMSPFYPHGNIPIPFSEDATAMCVEGVWQGLKVFENEDICMESFSNDTMKNLKRTIRRHGHTKGHRKGINGTVLLDYLTARKLIYIPTYKWVLDNVPSVRNILELIKSEASKRDVVLLDFNTNMDYRDLSSPLSHAALIKLYIEDRYPDTESAGNSSRRKKSRKKSKK